MFACVGRYIPVPKQPELESNAGSSFSCFWLFLLFKSIWLCPCTWHLTSLSACQCLPSQGFVAVCDRSVLQTFAFLPCYALILHPFYFLLRSSCFLHVLVELFFYCMQPLFPVCSLVLLAYWFHSATHCAPNKTCCLRPTSFSINVLPFYHILSAESSPVMLRFLNFLGISPWIDEVYYFLFLY